MLRTILISISQKIIGIFQELLEQVVSICITLPDEESSSLRVITLPAEEAFSLRVITLPDEETFLYESLLFKLKITFALRMYNEQ